MKQHSHLITKIARRLREEVGFDLFAEFNTSPTLINQKALKEEGRKLPSGIDVPSTRAVASYLCKAHDARDVPVTLTSEEVKEIREVFGIAPEGRPAPEVHRVGVSIKDQPDSIFRKLLSGSEVEVTLTLKLK